jgi:hypothetical protein
VIGLFSDWSCETRRIAHAICEGYDEHDLVVMLILALDQPLRESNLNFSNCLGGAYVL